MCLQALTDQEAQGSTLSGLCRSTHGLGSAALLPQTVARLAPASAETGRAAAAALMAAAPPASDRPIVLLKTMAPACIIHKAQGSTLSGLCRSTHSPGAAALTPQTVASLDVRAGPLPLSLPSPPEPAQAIDRTSAPDATLALLHPAQNPSSAPEGKHCCLHLLPSLPHLVALVCPESLLSGSFCRGKQSTHSACGCRSVHNYLSAHVQAGNGGRLCAAGHRIPACVSSTPCRK